MLVIGEQGRVNQIIWDDLPALTDQQLNWLERSIRTKKYADSLDGQTVTEFIDVRALIKNMEPPHE